MSDIVEDVEGDARSGGDVVGDVRVVVEKKGTSVVSGGLRFEVFCFRRRSA